jgi:glycine cleavage system H protein
LGLTDFAQSSLGDIVFVELQSVGTRLYGQSFGVVESINTISDLYSPLIGLVVEVNKEVENAPEQVNSNPYGNAWLIKIKLSNPDQVHSLLSAADYKNFLSTL